MSGSEKRSLHDSLSAVFNRLRAFSSTDSLKEVISPEVCEELQVLLFQSALSLPALLQEKYRGNELVELSESITAGVAKAQPALSATAGRLMRCLAQAMRNVTQSTPAPVTPVTAKVDNDSVSAAEDEEAKLERETNALLRDAIRTQRNSLHLAAERGFLNVVKLLLRRGADKNGRDQFNSTPLHTAALHGQVKVAQELILRGADINATAEDGRTPLHDAAASGSAEIIKLLHRFGADFGIVDDDQMTPLHFAADIGRPEAIRTLLNLRQNVNATDSHGQTALHYAASNGRVEITQILLDHDADLEITARAIPAHEGQLNNDGAEEDGDFEDEPEEGDDWEDLDDEEGDVHDADNDNNIDGEPAQDFVNDPSASLCTPLCCAAIRGHVEIVRFLLEHGADVDASKCRGKTPFIFAIEYGFRDVAKLLIQHGANVSPVDPGLMSLLLQDVTEDVFDILFENAAKFEETDLNGRDTLEVVARRGTHKAFKWLSLSNTFTDRVQDAVMRGRALSEELSKMEYWSDEVSWNPLHWAACAGQSELVRKFLDAGAPIESTDHAGFTALHYAASQGHSDIAAFLIARGANKTATSNADLETPLHIAASQNHVSVITTLLDAGANMDVRDAHGRNPLITAADFGADQACAVLLDRGADVNAIMTTPQTGGTALHCAAEQGWVETVSLLLKRKAHIDAGDHIHKTPLHCSIAQGYLDTAALLIKNGANVELIDDEDQCALDYGCRYYFFDVPLDSCGI